MERTLPKLRKNAAALLRRGAILLALGCLGGQSGSGLQLAVRARNSGGPLWVCIAMSSDNEARIGEDLCGGKLAKRSGETTGDIIVPPVLGG